MYLQVHVDLHVHVMYSKPSSPSYRTFFGDLVSRLRTTVRTPSTWHHLFVRSSSAFHSKPRRSISDIISCVPSANRVGYPTTNTRSVTFQPNLATHQPSYKTCCIEVLLSCWLCSPRRRRSLWADHLHLLV